eukprot:2282817-Pleurochrysis_carterae.AAC.1
MASQQRAATFAFPRGFGLYPQIQVATRAQTHALGCNARFGGPQGSSCGARPAPVRLRRRRGRLLQPTSARARGMVET